MPPSEYVSRSLSGSVAATRGPTPAPGGVFSATVRLPDSVAGNCGEPFTGGWAATGSAVSARAVLPGPWPSR